MKNVLTEVFKKLHIIHNIHIKHKHPFKKKSYSMEGEDLEIIKLTKHINKGFYVDAGCYHPLHLNNTYLLYKKNWNGINIDLSKFSIDLFNYMRPDDVNINSAVTNNDGEIIVYHQKEISQISTIKKEVAKNRMQGSIKEKKIISQKLTTILNNSKFNKKKIDFLNIDLEGADLEALNSLNFDIYRPKIICIEIIDSNIEITQTYKLLKNLKYNKVWSSKTNINHIFVDGLND